VSNARCNIFLKKTREQATSFTFFLHLRCLYIFNLGLGLWDLCLACFQSSALRQNLLEQPCLLERSCLLGKLCLLEQPCLLERSLLEHKTNLFARVQVHFSFRFFLLVFSFAALVEDDNDPHCCLLVFFFFICYNIGQRWAKGSSLSIWFFSVRAKDDNEPPTCHCF
jgi:hypothetical protein